MWPPWLARCSLPTKGDAPPGTPAPVKVTAQTAQNAVEAIRQRTPALVWKSARGEYSVDDAKMHAWYARHVAAGTWPPTGSEPDDL
jgi:hypothetical protein